MENSVARILREIKSDQLLTDLEVLIFSFGQLLTFAQNQKAKIEFT